MATSAEADYVARGLQETIRNVVTSTRELQIRRTSVTSSRTTQRTSVTSRPRPPRGGGGGGGGCFMPTHFDDTCRWFSKENRRD